MSIRRPLSRVLLGGVLLGGGVLAVAGGLALRGPGLIGVGLAATLAGCTAAGIARESPAPARGSVLEAAVWAACGTAGAVLLVAGVATVGGGTMAALAVAAGMIAFLVLRLTHGRAVWPAADTGAGVLRFPVLPHEESATTVTTRALGDEWLRTTTALAGRLTPAAREALVIRREEVLDELERRDPDGFARWLAAGPARASHPADFVRRGPVQRGPVADTDAA